MGKNNRKKLPLTSDIVFKRVFSREGNEEILKALLEAILNIKIAKVEVKNPELPRNLYDSKAGILDIKVEIDKNTICDVELQIQNENNIDKRSAFYMAKLLSDEIRKGEDYIQVKKTIVISIVNFDFYKRNSYHHIAHMRFDETKQEDYVDLGYIEEDEIATKEFEMHYIELPKFIRKNTEIKTEIEMWLWFIIGGEEKVKMAKEKNEEIKKAIDLIDEMSMDPAEWEMYESRRLAIMDYNTGIHQAKLDGIEEGKKEGIEEGKKEGIEEGKAEGKKEEKEKIAKELLKIGMKKEEVQKITELSIEEIEKINSTN